MFAAAMEYDDSSAVHAAAQAEFDAAYAAQVAHEERRRQSSGQPYVYAYGATKSGAYLLLLSGLSRRVHTATPLKLSHIPCLAFSQLQGAALRRQSA